jgi:alginate O-acetyltransferase complex protein AlgI
VLVLFSWVFFRAATLGDAMHYFGAMFALSEPSAAAPLANAELFSPYNLVMMALCVWFVRQKTQAWDFAKTLTPIKVLVVIVLFVLSIAAMFTQAFNPFLYFQF